MGTGRKIQLNNRIYLYLLVFLLIYLEFGYAMVVTSAVSGGIRMAILLFATLPLLPLVKKNDFKAFWHKVRYLGTKKKAFTSEQPLWVSENTANVKVIALFVFSILLIAFNALRDFAFKDNILLAVPIYVGCIIALTVEFKDLVRAFINVMTFLAGFSLVVLFFRVLTPAFIDKFPMLGYVYTSSAEVHDVFFSVSITNSQYVRNYGIAWEPGAFALLLCLSVFCVLAFEDKIRPVKLVLMVGAIVTTFSTMGYFVLAGILFSAMFQKRNKQPKIRAFLLCTAVAFIVLFLFLPQRIQDLVFEKLAGLFSSETGLSETTRTRINAIIYPFRAFLKSPIIGIGYGDFSILNKTLCDGVATNTILNWFAILGIALGLPFLYFYINAWLKSARYLRLNVVAVVVLIVSVVLLVSTESLLRISLMYVIVFYGAKENALKAFEDEDKQGLEAPAPQKGKKKILFILGAYYPRYSANGLCCKNVIDECVKQGYSVTCVVNATNENKEPMTLDGALIVPIKTRFIYAAAEWQEKKPTSKWRKTVLKAVGLINKAKLLIMSPFWPLISPLYAARFYDKAYALHKINRFDAVVAVYTPMEALSAGLALKEKYPQIKYVPYFLDSLSGGNAPRLLSKESALKRGLKTEKKVFTKADKIILMQSSKENHFCHNPDFVDKMIFLDIPMLKMVETDAVLEKGERDGIKLLFVGTIVRKVRDPKTIIDALMQLERTDVSCEFVGNIDCLEEFATLKEKMGERLKITGFIKHDQLVEKIGEADVLINIGNAISTMVPSKVFEYMSYAKSIISTYEIEQEPSKKYLCRYPSVLFLTGRDGAIENARKISAFLDGKEEKRIDKKQLTSEFVLNTPKAFVDTLRDEIFKE